MVHALAEYSQETKWHAMYSHASRVSCNFTYSTVQCSTVRCNATNHRIATCICVEIIQVYKYNKNKNPSNNQNVHAHAHTSTNKRCKPIERQRPKYKRARFHKKRTYAQRILTLNFPTCCTGKIESWCRTNMHVVHSSASCVSYSVIKLNTCTFEPQDKHKQKASQPAGRRTSLTLHINHCTYTHIY